MTHKKIVHPYYGKFIERDDGTKIQIQVFLRDICTGYELGFGNWCYDYNVIIHNQKDEMLYMTYEKEGELKKKICSNYEFYKFSLEEIKDINKILHESNLKFVTEDELKQAALELWEKLKP